MGQNSKTPKKHIGIRTPSKPPNIVHWRDSRDQLCIHGWLCWPWVLFWRSDWLVFLVLGEFISVEFRRLIPPCSQMVKNKGELIFGRKSSKIFRLRRAFLDVWSPFSNVSELFESPKIRPSADLRWSTTRGEELIFGIQLIQSGNSRTEIAFPKRNCEKSPGILYRFEEFLLGSWNSESNV